MDQKILDDFLKTSTSESLKKILGNFKKFVESIEVCYVLKFELARFISDHEKEGFSPKDEDFIHLKETQIASILLNVSDDMSFIKTFIYSSIDNCLLYTKIMKKNFNVLKEILKNTEFYDLFAVINTFQEFLAEKNLLEFLEQNNKN